VRDANSAASVYDGDEARSPDDVLPRWSTSSSRWWNSGRWATRNLEYEYDVASRVRGDRRQWMILDAAEMR